jgi:hypothetical protein
VQKDTAQRISRPLQRHILDRFQFLRPATGRQILLAPLGQQTRLILGSHRRMDVGLDPVCVDRLAAGREVFGGGQTDGGTVRQRDHALHRALAEGRLAHHQSPARILESTGDNLRTAGACTIDENSHGPSPRRTSFARRHIAPPGRRRTPLGVDDQLPGGQKLAGQFDRAAQQAPRIETQIQNERLDLLPLQLVECPHKFSARRLAELRDPHITDFGPGTLQHLRPPHTRHLDHLALDFESQRLGLALAGHRQVDSRPRLAAQLVDGITH